jgi:hypothetical protein
MTWSASGQGDTLAASSRRLNGGSAISLGLRLVLLVNPGLVLAGAASAQDCETLGTG